MVFPPNLASYRDLENLRKGVWGSFPPSIMRAKRDNVFIWNMEYGPGGAQRVREEILREMQWLLQERSGADRHLGIIGITPK